jgi:hypothetical protein
MLGVRDLKVETSYDCAFALRLSHTATLKYSDGLQVFFPQRRDFCRVEAELRARELF